MIGKISKGHYIKGLLNYHFSKIEKGEAELIGTTIYSNEKNDQLNFFLNNFSLHSNSRTKDYLLHASLNFSPEEHLSHELLNTIADEYLLRMGYEDVPYTIFLHNDKAHQHIHIVASRINYDGLISPVIHKKTMDININKEQCKILERKYNLVIAENKSAQDRKLESLNEINLSKYAFSNALLKDLSSSDSVLKTLNLNLNLSELYKNQPSDFDLKKLLGKKYSLAYSLLNDKHLIVKSKKNQILDFISICYNQATNQSEFELLVQQNPDIYCRILKDTKTRKPYYCFGLKSKSFYITEKKLDSKFSFQSISNLETTKKSRNLEFQQSIQKRDLSKSISSILLSAKNKHELEFNLKQHHIDFEYVMTNQNTDIQGIRFKSNKFDNALWFNGSDINRQFSWNKISSLFTSLQQQNLDNNKQKHKSNIEIKISKESDKTNNFDITK